MSLCVPLYCSSMEIISTLSCKLNFNNGVYWEIFSKYSNHNLNKILAELVNTKPKWWIFLLYDTRCHSTEPEEVPSSLSIMASCLRTGNLVNLNFVSLSLRGFKDFPGIDDVCSRCLTLMLSAQIGPGTVPLAPCKFTSYTARLLLIFFIILSSFFCLTLKDVSL